MRGYGETPAEEGDDEAEREAASVNFGEPVYSSDGERLGKIRGIEEGRFFVTTRERIQQMTIEHARSGHDFREAELMWRCTVCGEMGDQGRPSGGASEL